MSYRTDLPREPWVDAEGKPTREFRNFLQKTLARVRTGDIAEDSITNALLASMAQATIKGRASGAGTGNPTDLSAAQVITLLGLAAIATSGSASDLSAGTVPAARMPAHTGDVTSSAGSVALTLAKTKVQGGRVTTGAIGASASVQVTLTWGTAFADANYSVTASVVESTATTSTLRVHHIVSQSAAQVVVLVTNDDAGGAHTGTLHCIGVHD